MPVLCCLGQHGDYYENLIGFCASRCSFFTLVKVTDISQFCREFDAYEIDRPEHYPKLKSKYIYSGFESYNVYYRVCPGSISVLLQIGSVFSYLWDNISLKPPEDLTFYRSDGRVLFSSVTHEGECTLYLDDNEGTDIVSNCLWRKVHDK